MSGPALAQLFTLVRTLATEHSPAAEGGAAPQAAATTLAGKLSAAALAAASAEPTVGGVGAATAERLHVGFDALMEAVMSCWAPCNRHVTAM